MATRKKDDPGFERVELDAAVDESLGDDDLWNDLVTDHAVPPLKVKGIVLPQPTKEQVDVWRETSDVEAGERVLLGDKYDAIHELFNPLPQSAWANFNRKYLAHMFGMGDVDSLKG